MNSVTPIKLPNNNYLLSSNVNYYRGAILVYSLGTFVLWILGSLLVYNFFESKLSLIIYALILLIFLAIIIYKPIQSLRKKQFVQFNSNLKTIEKNQQKLCDFKDIDALVLDQYLQDDSSKVRYSLYLALLNGKKIDLMQSENLQELKQITVDLTELYSFRLRVERFADI